MYILTEDFDIVPDWVYDYALHGRDVSSHDTFKEANKRREEEFEENYRNEMFYSQKPY